MRPFLLLSLLLVSSLVHEAQGTRLKIAMSSVADHKLNHESVPDCQNELCSGKCRKLLKKTSGSIITTSKNKNSEGNKAHPKLEGQPSSDKLGRKEVNFSVDSSPVTENGVASHQRSPDILDIAGMDYAPATRTPPINN